MSSIARLFPTFLCSLVVLFLIVIGGIYGMKAKLRYVSFTNELRRNGKYAEWANENRNLLFLENSSLYAFLTFFFSFVIVGIFNLKEIARFFFICWIVFSVLAVIFSFILYSRFPEE